MTEPTSTRRTGRRVKSYAEHMKAIRAIERSREKPDTEREATRRAFVGALIVMAVLWAFS